MDRELSTIDLTAQKTAYALDFTAAMSDKEASDKGTACNVSIEATWDGENWQHVAGYVNWQGGELDRDDKPAVPSITGLQFDEKNPPKAVRIVTDAKADSTISVKTLEVKDMATVEVTDNQVVK